METKKVFCILLGVFLALSIVTPYSVNAVTVTNTVNPDSGVVHVKIVSNVTTVMSFSPALPGTFNLCSFADVSTLLAVGNVWQDNKTGFTLSMASAINFSIQSAYLNPTVYITNFSMNLEASSFYNNGLFVHSFITTIEYDLSGVVSATSSKIQINAKWRYVTPGGNIKVSGVTVNPAYTLGVNLSFFDVPLEEWNVTTENNVTKFSYVAPNYVTTEHTESLGFNINTTHIMDPTQTIEVQGTGYEASGNDITKQISSGSFLDALPIPNTMRNEKFFELEREMETEDTRTRVTWTVETEVTSITGTLPPKSGNWIINNATVVEDSTLIINGSIVINEAGALVLRNSKIYMNLSSDGEYWIEVYGNLTVLGSLITAYKTKNNYYIRVFREAKLRIEGSEISYAGYGEGGISGLWINTKNATIRNTTLQFNFKGIYLHGATNTIIANNTIQNNQYGVYLYYSTGNVLTNNTMQNNTRGVYFWYSTGNVLTNNIIQNNQYGVYLYYSTGNVLTNNIIQNNTRGVYFWGSTENILTNNIMQNNSDDGVYLYYSTGNVLTNNTIQNNTRGVYFWYSTENVLTNNTIQNNQYGVYLYYSTGNKIFFNNFINNTYHIGDFSNNQWFTDSEITYNYRGNICSSKMGNYWSGYLGGDPDGDGIGNDTYGGDTYPLMDPTWNYKIHDSDNDGLNDMLEQVYGTDPNLQDTDGDELPDGWEVSNGLNATWPGDAPQDPDNDGLTNLEEYQYGTDPNLQDTDGDELPDGWEVLAGTDPLNPNSYPRGDEVCNEYLVSAFIIAGMLTAVAELILLLKKKYF
ncbi:MAG: right-handed parallel beta-helix repeat-containing protein [Candidatus Odinarchaeota archaeon]|nr:right-handed parallel beta-helix repeat-containing protein [Candidatus Odinarchaeota archaeon]